MKLRRYTDDMMDVCAEFWWEIYRDRPYVHRPDGYQTVNSAPVGPGLFRKHVEAGLRGRSAAHWKGAVSPDSIFLAEDDGLAGILICSVNEEEGTGNIVSAYMQRDAHGDEAARLLVSEALEYFRKLRLRRAVVGPGTKTLEVECPIHLAVLEAGFAWEENWRQFFKEEGKDIVFVEPGYWVFLGGSLHGFTLRPEIKEKIEQLRSEGITIERCDAERFRGLRRLDTRKEGHIYEKSDVTYTALVEGYLVGWLFETCTFIDEGRMMGIATPHVIPSYWGRGMGKTLYHLGIEEVVRRGAQYGWTSASISSPARLIYRSIGYRYWYMGFGRMSKRLG